MKAIKYFRFSVAVFAFPLFFLINDKLFGQERVAPLKVNNQLPDISISGFLNQPGKQLLFSSLRGKLVILDFWGVHCSACLQGMPEMDSLQHAFGDKIKILLVTNDKAEEVTRLFTRIHMDEKIKHLEVITDDRLLHALFPHQSEPHHVWIDPKGIYRYGTFFYNTTRKKIVEMLDRNAIAVTQKHEDSTIISSIPLIYQVKASCSKNVLEYSLLMKGLNRYFEDNAIVFHSDSITHSITYFQGTNLSPLTLLQCAFNPDVYGFDIGYYDLENRNYRMLIDVKDSSLLYPPIDLNKRDQWYQDNSICYELQVPRGIDIYKRMQAELNEKLPYTGTVEHRNVLCYALIKRGNTDALRSQGGNPAIRYSREGIHFQNQPVQQLTKVLVKAQGQNSLPLVDNTGVKENIDLTIKLPSKEDSMEKINDQLKQYGLEIERRTLSIRMLVVRDK